MKCHVLSPIYLYEMSTTAQILFPCSLLFARHYIRKPNYASHVKFCYLLPWHTCPCPMLLTKRLVSCTNVHKGLIASIEPRCCLSGSGRRDISIASSITTCRGGMTRCLPQHQVTHFTMTKPWGSGRIY